MISVIIPALNEEGAIGRSIDDLRSTLDAAGISEYEIIVVNDGSSDSTGTIARERGAHVIENLHNLG
jgi:polyisoprenyl-phosphate glycosyltransferase